MEVYYNFNEKKKHSIFYMYSICKNTFIFTMKINKPIKDTTLSEQVLSLAPIKNNQRCRTDYFNYNHNYFNKK